MTLPSFAVGQKLVAADLQALADALATYGQIPATPQITSSNGTVTSGTTETRDAVLGNYTFTAVAGRRYRAILSGRGMDLSVADDRFLFRLRYAVGATPTASSTLIAEAGNTSHITGTNGTNTVWTAGSFIPGAGTIVVAAFTVRVNGTGTCLPIGNNTSLYVEDIGGV